MPALIEGGWLVVDGGRALVTGDNVTPATDRYAGQLGPWAEVVRAAGLEPRSMLMNSIHVVLGVTWLLLAIAFALRTRWAWWGMIGCAMATLWYLPAGTLLSLIQIALLLLAPLRGAREGVDIPA